MPLSVAAVTGVTLTRKIFNLDLRYYDTNLSKEDCFVFTGRRSQRDAKSKSQLPGPSRSPEAREARDRGFHVGRLASGWGGGSGISIQQGSPWPLPASAARLQVHERLPLASRRSEASHAYLPTPRAARGARCPPRDQRLQPPSMFAICGPD